MKYIEFTFWNPFRYEIKWKPYFSIYPGRNGNDWEFSWLFFRFSFRDIA